MSSYWRWGEWLEHAVTEGVYLDFGRWIIWDAWDGFQDTAIESLPENWEFV